MQSHNLTEELSLLALSSTCYKLKLIMKSCTDILNNKYLSRTSCRYRPTTGPILAVVCGATPPLNAIETPDNEVYIRFVSDGSGVGSGFNLTYQTSEDG